MVTNPYSHSLFDYHWLGWLDNPWQEGTSTVFLPNDASTLSSMISQAITLYKKLGENISTDVGLDKNRKFQEDRNVIKPVVSE
ncbi:hypothetical protein M0R45_038384 [Rubus argutus]|uniref:Uncharacterized protein n=1 Tax=Rubus argutus TaxID=59490 RepID=A0AAW1W3L0_RUBAR